MRNSHPVIRALYGDGMFVQAYERALEDWGPVAGWSEPSRAILGGRILSHVGAPRTCAAMHVRALRNDPQNHEAMYFGVSGLLHSRGPLAAWRMMRANPKTGRDDDQDRAEWLTLEARVLSCFRRFSAAESALDRADQLHPEHPWNSMERSFMLEQADRYEEALEAAHKALALSPSTVAAVLQVAGLLQILDRSDEAMELLTGASTKFEAFMIFTMMVPMLIERGDLIEALQSLDRCMALVRVQDKQMKQWLAATRFDLLHQSGDDRQALAEARKAGTPFYDRIAEILEGPADETERVQLPVEFVRQHHMTCAPATLSAISRFWGRQADHLELAEKICYAGTPAHSERTWAEQDGWAVREFSLTWEVATALIDRGAPFTLTTVNPGNAHMQAVIGYDKRLRTLLVRDTFYPQLLEYLADETIEQYRANGPRGMVMVPLDRAEILDGLPFKDALLHDRLHTIQGHLKKHDRSAAQLIQDEFELEHPDHPMTIWSRLVMADYDASETDMLAATTGLLELYPEDANLTLNQIRFMRSLGRREERLPILERACEATPVASPLALQFAQEYATDARRYPESMEVLRRALAQEPDCAPLYHAMANILWNQRELDEGRELYRIAASLDETQEGFAQSWFLAERHFGRTDEALAALQRRFSRFGKKSSYPARTLCEALCQQGQFQKGLDILDEAMALRPDDGELALSAAETHASLGHGERAAELLQHAREHSSRGVWLRTAASLAGKGRRLTEALHLWQELLEIEPLAGDAHEHVTELLHETRSLSAALDHMEAAVAQFPHSLFLKSLQVNWLKQEGPEPAARALRELMEIHPDVAQAHRDYALLLADLRQFDAAQQQLELAGKLEPASRTWFSAAGWVSVLANDFEKARSLFMEAIKIDVDDDFPIAQLIAICNTNDQRRGYLAEIKQELKRQSTQGAGVLAYSRQGARFLASDEMLKELEELRESRPDLWQLWSAVASQMCDLDQIDQALAITEEATERFPLVAELWTERAQIFRTAQRTQDEIQALERALQIAPDWVPAIQALVDAHDRTGRMERSREIIQEAIERNPLESTYYAYMAHLLWKRGDREGAFAKLTHSVELCPNYEWGWSTLVEWAEQSQQPERVIELAREGTRARPMEVLSWLILARTLQRFETLQEQLEALREALKLAPRCIEAHDSMAHTLAMAQRYDAALEACKPPVFGGDLPTRLVGRSAWIVACQGRHEQAVKILEPLLKREPKNVWGWNILLQCHLSREDQESYIRAAKEMAKLLPTDTGALERRADALLREGDREGAKADLLRALNLSSDFTSGSDDLLNLYLEDNEVDEAAELVDRVAPHIEPSGVLTLRVRVAAARRDEESAQEHMLALCAHKEADLNSISVAAEAMEEAGFGEGLASCLEKALTQTSVTSHAGPVLVRLHADKKAWDRCAMVLDGLDANGEPWEQMASAYLEALFEGGEGQRLVAFIAAKRSELRRSDAIWGVVGTIYATASLCREALDWMRDWKRRENLAPWMLSNLVIALREKKRDHEARVASLRALSLKPDHSTPSHEIWLALDEALTGNIAAAQERMTRLGIPDVTDFYRCVMLFTQALLAMASDDSRRMRVSFRNARQKLDEAMSIKVTLRRDRLLNRVRRRTVMAIARRKGGLGGYVWALRFLTAIGS